MNAPQDSQDNETPPRGPLRLPSIRASAGLAAAMLGLGVAIGAAIGPAPSASLAGQELPRLVRSLVTLGAARESAPARSAASPQTPARAAASTPRPSARPASASGAGTGAQGAAGAGAGRSKTHTLSPAVSPTSTRSPARAPGTGGGQGALTAPVLPVTSVWLITLAGSTFAQALAQPAAAPYIDGQLLRQGALLSDWSALAGQAFASEAGLLGGAPPQNLDAIVQPPCPEGAAGASCQPETTGALAAADAFLRASLPTITASASYRAHGLIVITFGTVAGATAASLPAGASTATLGSVPPVGVLLLSPFTRSGTRPSETFDPTSPRRSVSALLR